MFESFFIAAREALQCGLLLALVLFYQPVRESRRYATWLAAGVLISFLCGFPLGFFPFLSKNLPPNETWTFWRYVCESLLFYSGILLAIRRPQPVPMTIVAGLFAIGFFLFFFEARMIGFLIRDIGTMRGNIFGIAALGVAGTLAGFSLLIPAGKYLKKIPLHKAFTPASLLMALGAFQFWFGGVAELERENILIPLERGLFSFLGESVKSMQSLLMISDHPFLSVAGSGAARRLAGDRTALAVTVLFITAPPLFILTRLFARPDPDLEDFHVPARRRQKVAFFRNELLAQTIPVMTVFIVLVVLLHAVNISLNPLYEPAPVPVRDEGNENELRIPTTDKLGDFTDKKLRKYAYSYGNRQIVLLAVLKADGSVGVALDECEICRPADWNVDAKGYAQRGGHLICKYCMTPIAISTVNNPGGCNPIPVPFRLEDREIIVSLPDLVAVFQKAQELEKKGTHL